MDIGQILANLGFDWRVALANLINFLVIVWILKRFAFGPIAKRIEEREEKIKKGIEDSNKASTELQMAKQLSEKATMEAREQSNKIIAKAQKESEHIIAESKVQQQEQAKQIIDNANKIIEKDKQKMFTDLKEQLADLIVMTTEKFIRTGITKEAKKEIANDLSKTN